MTRNSHDVRLETPSQFATGLALIQRVDTIVDYDRVLLKDVDSTFSQQWTRTRCTAGLTGLFPKFQVRGEMTCKMT